MDQNKLIRNVAQVSYRAADKFFKFTSWAIVIVAMIIAERQSHNPALRYVISFAEFTYCAALMSQLVYFAGRDPSDFGVPADWHLMSQIIQIVLSFAVLTLLTSPYLYLDQILDAFMQARLK